MWSISILPSNVQRLQLVLLAWLGVDQTLLVAPAIGMTRTHTQIASFASLQALQVAVTFDIQLHWNREMPPRVCWTPPPGRTESRNDWLWINTKLKYFGNAVLVFIWWWFHYHKYMLLKHFCHLLLITDLTQLLSASPLPQAVTVGSHEFSLSKALQMLSDFSKPTLRTRGLVVFYPVRTGEDRWGWGWKRRSNVPRALPNPSIMSCLYSQHCFDETVYCQE